jgi:hypothetical protein
MSQRRLPPPAPAACLDRPYPSSQKGGTWIAEDVTDRDEHRRRLCDPDGYRLRECPHCHHRVLHVHDYVVRVLVADSQEPVIKIVRYECAGCEAIWRILPAFVARHLWRSWDTVKAVTVAAPAPPTQPAVPERTLQRWRARLSAWASTLVQLFATSWAVRLVRLALAVGHDGSREELVHAYAAEMDEGADNPLAAVAGHVQRLMPGLRLM